MQLCLLIDTGFSSDFISNGPNHNLKNDEHIFKNLKTAADHSPVYTYM